MKGKGQKEEKKDEEEIKPQQEVILEEGWKLPYDAEFHNLVKEAVKSVLPLDDGKMYTALAVYVSRCLKQTSFSIS